MRTPAISVVVPTYQRRTQVEQLLSSLCLQTVEAEEFEVIVSIDGSTDGTYEVTERFSAPYRLRGLWQPNQGRASACNAGIAVSEAKLIVILDDDMEPVPDFLAAHQRAHSKVLRLGVLGAVPVDLDSANGVSGYIGRKFNQHLARLAEPGHVFAPRDFYTGNFSISREVLREAGGFDEAFRIYGNEDIELCLRLADVGVHFAYCPEARAKQGYTKSFAATALDHISKGQTAVYLACKAPQALSSMKLSAYREGSRKRRWVRTVLLWAADRQPAVGTVVVRTVELLERAWGAMPDLVYEVALDYCFWLGARMAERKGRANLTGDLVWPGTRAAAGAPSVSSQNDESAVATA